MRKITRGDLRVGNLDAAFAEMVKEAMASANFIPDDDATDLSWGDKVFYYIENKMAASSMTKFYLLGAVIVMLQLGLTVLWKFASARYNTFHDGDDRILAARGVAPRTGTGLPGDYDEEGQPWLTSGYLVFQTLMAGGFEAAIDPHIQPEWALVFLFSLFAGLGVFAVFIGFVNESVTAFFSEINEGQSKIAANGHTLILGWNESTVRVVCQIAFLRRAFLKQNKSLLRKLFWWKRIASSTPVAERPIVILCDTKTKQEMDSIIAEALSERGINPKIARIGEHIVCRIGNPTDPHDLLRAGAHRATSILVMMTDLDKEEEEKTNGVISDGATLSTVLGLRHVMLKAKLSSDTSWNDFRCVVHTESSTTVDGRDYMEGAKFTNSAGGDVVHFVDLRAFVNTLMMICAAQPGLSSVFMELLSFDGKAFRSRKAADLGVVGRTVGDLRFHFDKAIVAGVVDTRERLDAQTPKTDHGIACDAAREITEHDRVIIISDTSSPPLWKGQRESLKPLMGDMHVKQRPPFDILFCGWRLEWDDPNRFASRVRSFTRSDAFADRMAPTNFATVGETWVSEGVTLRHMEGDGSDPEILKEVMSLNKYEAAIVMGTCEGVTLSSESRDRRVQKTMLLLRMTQKLLYGTEAPMHVVGENAIDSSAALALTPMSMRNIPDFVNTQAINARALVQALAYPFMQAAIAQLFYNVPGAPQMCLVHPGSHLIPIGSASFAEVKETVARTYPDDVVVGLVTADGQMLLGPDLDFVHPYVENDQLVLLTRRFSGEPAAKDSCAAAYS
jgi:hypothetical protein